MTITEINSQSFNEFWAAFGTAFAAIDKRAQGPDRKEAMRYMADGLSPKAAADALYKVRHPYWNC